MSTQTAAVAVKESPILFSSEMIRAILQDKKTMTRRIIKPVRGFEHNNILKHGMPHAADPWAVWWHGPETDRVGCLQECPYGRPGERLWLREATESYLMPNLLTGEPITNSPCGRYVADCSPVLDQRGFDLAWWYSKSECPSIHMPRWASRITLEVTEVRVERLQCISDADISAEGVTESLVSSVIAPIAARANAAPDHWIGGGSDEGLSYCRACAKREIRRLKKAHPKDEYYLDGGWATESDSQNFCEICHRVLDNNFTTYACQSEIDHFRDSAWSLAPLDCLSLQNILGSYGWDDDARTAPDDAIGPAIHRLGMQALWDSINGKRPGCSWSDNPWVWVVGFRRLEHA